MEGGREEEEEVEEGLFKADAVNEEVEEGEESLCTGGEGVRDRDR